MEDRLLMGLFLCSGGQNEVLQQLRPEWMEMVHLSSSEKLSFLGVSSVMDIFPFPGELSSDILKESFSLSHLTQPDLFLRMRPGREKNVKEKLKDAGLDYIDVSGNCIALSNATKIDQVVEINREAVVQDLSSQRIAEFLKKPVWGLESKMAVWDCCAASGGKSILLYDLHPSVDLTVSDIRESILVNLRERFKEAGINKYKSFVADLASPVTGLPVSDFDLVIADVPCSGSGTWGRTPEQLYFFEKEKIDSYASLQRKIISNVIPHIRPGGYLLYITCSVFKKENEDTVAFIKSDSSLQLVRMEILKGYDQKADTMFAALLQKPL